MHDGGGRRPPHVLGVHLHVLRVRTRLLLPRRTAGRARRAPAGVAAGPGGAWIRRARRHLVRRLPNRLAGRLAADRHHRRRPVGRRPRRAGTPRPGHPGAVRGAAVTADALLGAVEVVDPGPLSTIQDRGRRGWAHLGVPRAGALDRGAAALARRLVGGRPDDAVIETTVGGVVLRPRRAVTLAVTGAA